MVFKISNTSYANHVLAGTYKINSIDINESWNDAAGKAHRRLKRKKIQGTTDMFFRTIEEFNAFLAVIEASKTTSQSIPMTVTVNNLNDDKTIDAFVDFDPVRSKDGMHKDYILQYTLKIEER